VSGLWLVPSVCWVLLFWWRWAAAIRFLRRVRRFGDERRTFLSRAVTATGEVIDNQIESVRGRPELTTAVVHAGGSTHVGFTTVPGAPGLLFRPIVDFTTGDGRRVRFAAEAASSRSWVPGQLVPVSYDPVNPHRAEITEDGPVPKPTGATLRVAAHATLLASAILILTSALVTVARGSQDPTAVDGVILAIMVIAPTLGLAGSLLWVIAWFTTPRWQKRL